MRVYLSYNSDGEIRGYDRSDHEWPEGYDIMETNPAHPLARANRQAHADADENFAGFIAFDCDCAYDEGCHCDRDPRHNCYVENGYFVEKPALVIKINGNVQSPTSDANPLVRASAAPFTLTLEADVPDGTQLTLKRAEAKLAPTDPILTFSGGSASCQLVAPAQGLVGVVAGYSKHIRPFRLHVLGWLS